ncbi:hypothetical protein BGW41_000324 [Actinomortierella wolfii]|nr:hypothetical protein BGW41_000324 [Actinomortierella wolfii]
MTKHLSNSSISDRPPSHSPIQKRRSVSGNRALWSEFLKRHYKEVKEQNPSWDPKVIRRNVGQMWANSPENPKNQ